MDHSIKNVYQLVEFNSFSHRPQAHEEGQCKVKGGLTLSDWQNRKEIFKTNLFEINYKFY